MEAQFHVCGLCDEWRWRQARSKIGTPFGRSRPTSARPSATAGPGALSPGTAWLPLRGTALGVLGGRSHLLVSCPRSRRAPSPTTASAPFPPPVLFFRACPGRPRRTHSVARFPTPARPDSAQMAEKRPSTDGLVDNIDPRESTELQELPYTEKSTEPAAIPLKEKLITCFWIALNTFSTLGLIFLSKRVFSDEQLHACQLMVVMWHFTATGLVLFVATRGPFRAFKAIRLNPWDMLPVCAFFAGYVVLGNLSLTYNSIGFYQLSKVMTTPCVVLINFALFQKTVTRYMLAAILITCIGVSLTINEEAKTALFGVVIATLAFCSTALYQIWIGKKIEDFAVSAPQLLLNQAPISVLLLVPFVPFFDKIPDFTKVPTDILYSVCASGIFASLYNLSQFLIIGRTSALTFNIVSHLKTIMILSIGWYSEGKILSTRDWCGVALALGGGWVYSHLAMKAKQQTRK
ncbi:TPT-domain-containing protein [Amniculicola lignicola CBS 123094]|uniref:TPT-domain-containing protein n=1 Tax=Amniculicola lignicola CBS 123094 TaxID=1392246 RepID=A0A6A5WTZ6_9PLEO|nr:TPT-domain-containing protein [Amniculicola lignicola CBS 123094]